MNSKELGIYTALTHSTSPEDYRIIDNGTKLYVLVPGGMVYFEGEKLDQMSSQELYEFYLRNRDEYLKNLC